MKKQKLSDEEVKKLIEGAKRYGWSKTRLHYELLAEKISVDVRRLTRLWD